MIVRERPRALMLFFVLKGSVVQRIWPQLLLIGLLSLAVVAVHRIAPGTVPGVNPAPFALVGIALSVFLSFRNGASYERWWEARKLWGQIVQTARDIARQTVVLDAPGTGPSPERREVLEAIIGFAHAAVREQRRETAAQAEGTVPRQAQSADIHLRDAASTIGRLVRANRLVEVEALALNDSLLRLSQALVGCERLSNTPLPFAYRLLLHRTAYIFCFVLPFGFADSLGWATPLGAMLVAYTFFGLDALAEELEEPFGLMPNDLPIQSYATSIEIALRKALGDTDLPDVPAPRDYILT